MFQTFDAPTRPLDGPPRLAALRAEMAAEGLDGFLVPRADAHQGEYVAPRDERLAWLTGFTGSAGFAAILGDQAGVFADGRYKLQVRDQIALVYAAVDWPQTQLGPWLVAHAPQNGVIGFDPWLHTAAEVERLKTAVKNRGLTLRPCENLIDRIWSDQPAAPSGPIYDHPQELAGVGSAEKRAQIAEVLIKDGQDAVVLSLPDSIAWLLNIRGSDIARIPVVLAFAILDCKGRVKLFVDPTKTAGFKPDADVKVFTPDEFQGALAQLGGVVRVDPKTAPLAISTALEAGGASISHGDDPCLLPKACKNTAELEGTVQAHLRDGAAMIEFLAWLDAEAPKGHLTEIEVVEKLEEFRRATNSLRDISFDTICGAGGHGAIVHYRVSRETDKAIAPGQILLVDSGGQYVDGTTDITRTVAVGGNPGAEERAAFTRVLQGMIAISRLRWPHGLAGRDLDALARYPLWLAGQDYDHGTGHGVGTFLSVHEGPQRLSRLGEVPLEPGMILSNEPGYYSEGAFGIRIENLIVVQEAPPLNGADDRRMLTFRTLTWVPIDLSLVEVEFLSAGERDWLNAYHAQVFAIIAPRVSDSARDWLEAATRPL